MRYGLYLPNFGAWGDPVALVNLARDAENAGWDGFFLWDHIGGFRNTMADPWVALGGIASATESIRIGTTVTPVPRRRPHKLARETATVDRLSGGRLIFGAGSGEGADEFDRMGEEIDHRRRGAMLDEALDVINRLWSGESVDHRGEHYTVQTEGFAPTPIQKPRPPVWIGGFWPYRRPMRRAAQWDGVMPLFQRGGAEPLLLLQECLAFITQERGSLEGFDVVYQGVTPGDDPEAAAEIVAPYSDAGVTWWLEPIAPYRYGEGMREPWDIERLRARVLAGPPAR
jgi:alkanesulfonate monooxygenase SsuD/methylene tetrahydromethanopterin reductase-like flavin-dependent oxidoreductase (luciferase family)